MRLRDANRCEQTGAGITAQAVRRVVVVLDARQALRREEALERVEPRRAILLFDVMRDEHGQQRVVAVRRHDGTQRARQPAILQVARVGVVLHRHGVGALREQLDDGPDDDRCTPIHAVGRVDDHLVVAVLLRVRHPERLEAGDETAQLRHR